MCLHLGDLCALVVFFCLGGLLLPSALVDFSLHLITPASDLPPSGRRGGMVNICCLFVLSPSPWGRTVCNGLFSSVLFCFLCVCVYIFLYMHMWKHRYRHGFPSSRLPSHSQINTSEPTALSPEIRGRLFGCTVSRPQRILAPDLCFRECKHGKICQRVLHLPGGGLGLE